MCVYIYNMCIYILHIYVYILAEGCLCPIGGLRRRCADRLRHESTYLQTHITQPHACFLRRRVVEGHTGGRIAEEGLGFSPNPKLPSVLRATRAA